MNPRAFLVSIAATCCLAIQSVASGDDTPQRTYFQALTGYYSPAKGWEVFSECRTEMEQPLDYSNADFVKLPIGNLDKLTREAKLCRDLYRRLKTADDRMGLSVMSPKNFWASRDKAPATVDTHEHAASLWPQYRDNMQRYGLNHKSATDFLSLPKAEREKLHADSRGTQRSWTQAAARRYTAADGWKTYKESRTYLGETLRYTEYEFTHLPIVEVDTIARSTKARHDLYRRYETAVESLGLEPLSPTAFFASDDQTQSLVEKAEDAAAKWPVYHSHMLAMGEKTVTQQAFYDLDVHQRRSLYDTARGTQRTTLQFMTRHHSADTGWIAYSKAMDKLSITSPHTERDYKNLPIAQIDALTRHAVDAEDLVSRFAELCKAAQQSNKYTPAYVYGTNNLRPLFREYKDLHEKWATRIVYSNSCERIGVKPNWSAFDARSDKERTEAATLSTVAAENFSSYATLCDKLEIPKDSAFVSQSLEGQRAEIDQLSHVLWDQRKETVSLYAKRTGEVVVWAAMIFLAYKATQYANSQPTPAPEITRRPSQIDRTAFNRQRSDYWRNEASTNPNRYGSNPENLGRMMSGRAPMGNDGFPFELHHPGGNPNATLIPMTRTEHRLGDNYTKNHPWMFEVKP